MNPPSVEQLERRNPGFVYAPGPVPPRERRRGLAVSVRQSNAERPTATDRRPPTSERVGIVELCAIGFFVVAPFTWVWDQEVAGVNIDPADVLLLPALAAFIFLRKSLLTLPLRGAFLLYLVLTAAAYAKSVYALGYLTDPASALYQFSRYAWKPALAFPLAYWLIRGRASRTLVLPLVLTIIAVADANALSGIWQGRSGERPTGLFGALGHGNNLASSVLLPAFLALGLGVAFHRMTAKVFLYGSFAAMVLTLWYTGSRGGVIAFVIGLMVYLAVGQARVKLIGSGAVILMTLLVAHPDFGKKSGIRGRFLEVAEGTQAETLDWRLTQRWPYFIDKVLENPWLGVGSDEDLSLGDSANTPHNGYLSIAVKSGLPSLGLFLWFLVFTLWRAAKVAVAGVSPLDRGIGAAVVGGVAAIAMHNVIDSTFGFGSAGYLFWMACGVVAAMPLPRTEDGSGRGPVMTAQRRTILRPASAGRHGCA